MRSLNGLMIALAGAAAPALAAGGNPPAVLTVGPTASVTLTADLATFVDNASGTGSSLGVTGTVTLSASDFNNPADLQLLDLSLAFDPAPTAQAGVDGGAFLGSADPVGITLAGIDMDGAASVVAEGNRSGIATFNIDVIYTGEAFATYDFVGIDPQTDATIDLASLDPSGALLDIFALSSTAGELTMEATLFLNAVTIPFEPGLIEITLSSASSVTMQATGGDPNVGPGDVCSRADLAEPCGTLDLADIVAFVTGFSGGDPISDFNNDGLFDLQDIVAFVSAFGSDICDPNGTYYCYGATGALTAIEFHEGNAAYAMGEHSALTAGAAIAGAALMLGFSTFRRKHA
jgi:hypothetical protein